ICSDDLDSYTDDNVVFDDSRVEESLNSAIIRNIHIVPLSSLLHESHNSLPPHHNGAYMLSLLGLFVQHQFGIPPLYASRRQFLEVVWEHVKLQEKNARMDHMYFDPHHTVSKN